MTTVTTTKTVQKGIEGVDPRVQMNRAWAGAIRRN